MRTVRILVTGSREFKWEQAVWDQLTEDREALSAGDKLIIVHGDCPRGVDAFAKAWALHCRYAPNSVFADVDHEPYPADWNGPYGKGAGKARNSLMVNTRPDKARVFSVDDSNGTWDCFDKIRAARIPWRAVGAYS